MNAPESKLTVISSEFAWSWFYPRVGILQHQFRQLVSPRRDRAWPQGFWFPGAALLRLKIWAVRPPAKLCGQFNMKRLMEYVGEKSKAGIEIFAELYEACQWLAQQKVSGAASPTSSASAPQ